MAVMVVWAAALITYGVSTGISMVAYILDDDFFKWNCWALTYDSVEPGLNGVFELDMALDSVDDMYTGCKDKMKSKVQNIYLKNEKNKDTNFTKAWNESEKQYPSKYNRKKKIWESTGTELSTVQKMAIYAYTLDEPKLYLDFNNAVRTQKHQYKTTFRYHTLHFLLTDALQTLNARKSEAERCLTGYRRVNRSFNSKDLINKVIRLGSFTSTSMGRYPSPKRFGDKSCFEIVTCSGADISLYSKLGESEGEILIPPYEVFKVTKIETTPNKSLQCEVVYKLKSTGQTLSNTNCALFLNTFF